jgi:hypothetical protein
MIDEGAQPRLPRARRIRFVAAVATALWIATLVTFFVLLAFGADGATLTALGSLASLLFAASFGLQALASRRELREMAVITARDDLRAARSRR